MIIFFHLCTVCLPVYIEPDDLDVDSDAIVLWCHICQMCRYEIIWILIVLFENNAVKARALPHS